MSTFKTLADFLKLQPTTSGHNTNHSHRNTKHDCEGWSGRITI